MSDFDSDFKKAGEIALAIGALLKDLSPGSRTMVIGMTVFAEMQIIEAALGIKKEETFNVILKQIEIFEKIAEIKTGGDVAGYLRAKAEGMRN